MGVLKKMGGFFVSGFFTTTLFDKPFTNESVENPVGYSVLQSFHCDLFTVNLNIYNFVCLERGR